ncbi:MAG: hypothetical protein ACM30I_01860 [Gemmatimonas sp.]
MTRASPLLASFNGGEWSPNLYGRSDLSRYGSACKRLENFIPLVQGAATRRPGTRFIAATKDTAGVRLIPFEFSIAQAYVIEAGDGYFRFYMGGGRIETAPGMPYEIATPFLAQHLDRLKWTQSADVLYLCHPELQPRKLTRTGHTSWTLTPLDAQDGPYLDVNGDAAKTLQPSGTTGTITVTAAGFAPFAASDVGRPLRIRHGVTWGWARITAFMSPTQVTADVKAAFASATASSEWRLGAWSAANGWPGCVSFHEERLVFAGSLSNPQTLWLSVSGEFESFTPTRPDGTVLDDSAITVTIADDRVNAIRWLSSGKELAIGTVGGEFTAAASSLNEAITPSNITVRRESTIGVADAMPVRIGQSVLYVQRARRRLMEFGYSLQSDGHVSTELSILARHLLRSGLRHIAWQQEPWSVLWGCRDDGALIGVTYLPEQQVTGWHRHSLGGTGVAVLSLATIRGSDGDELWLAVERTIGGVPKRSIELLQPDFAPDDESNRGAAFFVDCGLTFDGTMNVALTPGATAGPDVIFTAGGAAFDAGSVGREIHRRYGPGDARLARAEVTAVASATQVHARIIAPFPDTVTIPAGSWRLTASTLGGLDHLEGETVQILADGASHADKQVSGGSVVLDRNAAVAHVGLPYRSTLETLSLEAGSLAGTALSKAKRIHRAAVRLLDTLGCRVGRDGTLDEVLFRSSADPMDEGPQLFTGDKVIEFPAGWDREMTVTVLQDLPLPCTVTAIVPQVTTNDG